MTTLLPHQVPHAASILATLRTRGAALDASDTGTGKSYVASWCAENLTSHPSEVLVLCPKAVISMWSKLLPEATVLNYEKAIRPSGGLFERWGGRKNAPRPTAPRSSSVLVLDEAHRTSNWKTKTSSLARSLADRADFTLMLSATIADNPLSLRPAHEILQFTDKDFYPWARSRGCSQIPMGINKFWAFTSNKERRQAAMEAVHKDLFPSCGGRMVASEIEGYPGETRIAGAFDLPAQDRVRLNNALLNTGEDHMSQRLEVELAKVPLFVSLALDHTDQERKVVAFFNFVDSQREFVGRTGCPSIHGGQSVGERDEAVEHFQLDNEPVIAVNIQAGGSGISLHDHLGDGQRVSLISPPYSSKDLVQCFGRTRRTGAKSDPIHYLVFAADSPEERVVDLVQTKLRDLSTLLDGYAEPEC